MKKYKNQIIALAIVIALYVVINICLGGRFLTMANMKNVLSHAVFPAFVAWGMMFIFSAGVVDLSIGANILLSANVGAICAVTLGLGYPGLILGSVISAVVLQHISTRCVVTLKIPSWIGGLGMALIFEAVLSLYATVHAEKAGSAVINLGDSYRLFGQFSVMIVMWIIGVAAAYLLYCYTPVGINVRAIGGDEAVAQMMGINKKRTMIIGAIVGGVFIGLAALIQLCYGSSMPAKSGLGSIDTIFKSLATVLLAQSFGFLVVEPVGILISSFIIMSIFNILTIIGVPSGTGQEICLGIIVVLCGVISQIRYKGVVK